MTLRPDDIASRTDAAPSDLPAQAGNEHPTDAELERRLRQRSARLGPEQLRAAANVLAHAQSRQSRAVSAPPSSR